MTQKNDKKPLKAGSLKRLHTADREKILSQLKIMKQISICEKNNINVNEIKGDINIEMIDDDDDKKMSEEEIENVNKMKGEVKEINLKKEQIEVLETNIRMKSNKNENEKKENEMKQMKKSEMLKVEEEARKEYSQIVKDKLKLAPIKISTYPTFVKRSETHENYLMMASRKSMQFQKQYHEVEINEVENEIESKRLWDADQCILEVIGNRNKCKLFTNFEYDDFNLLYDYATHLCSFNIDNKWIEIKHEIHSLTKPFGKSKIPAKFVFFVMIYQLKHVQTFEYLFDRMKLDRFSNSNKDESKRNFSWRLFNKAVEKFSNQLYDSLVESRRKIGINLYPSLSEGRSETFKYIIDNLDACKFIVDGKNQNIPQQYIQTTSGEQITDTKYFNHKTRGNGVKILCFVDCMGFFVHLTNHVQASIHDSTLYNDTFDGLLIPENYYSIGDGGFRGCARCICNYPKNLCSVSCKGKTFVTNRYIPVTSKNGSNQYDGIGCFYGTVKEFKYKRKMEGYFDGIFKIDDKNHHFKIKGDAEIHKIETEDYFIFRMKQFNSSNELQLFGNKKITISCDCYGYPADSKYLKCYNKALSSIRIIIENSFGRTNLLWKASGTQYKWNLGIYDKVTKIVFASTNMHLHLMPIRNFPFQLFCFNTNNSLGLKLSQISKLKLPKECLKIIGIESDEALIEREKTIGDYYEIIMRIPGPLQDNLKVRVPIEQIETNYVFQESNSSQIKDRTTMPSESEFDAAINIINDTLFKKISINDLYSYYNINSSNQTMTQQTIINETNEINQPNELNNTEKKVTEFEVNNLNDEKLIKMDEEKKLFSENQNISQLKDETNVINQLNDLNNIEKEMKTFAMNDLNDENLIKMDEEMEVPFVNEIISQQEHEINSLNNIQNENENNTLQFESEMLEDNQIQNEIGQDQSEKNKKISEESDDIQIVKYKSDGNSYNLTHFNPITLDGSAVIIPENIHLSSTIKLLKRKLDSQLLALILLIYKNYIKKEYYLLDPAWFNSIFEREHNSLEILSNESNENNLLKINDYKRRMFGKSIDTYEKIILMCNHSNVHWSIGILEIMNSKYIVIDSLNWKNGHTNFVKLLDKMNICRNIIQIEHLKTTPQSDSWTCGYHMLYYFKELFVGKTYQNYEIVNKFNRNDFENHMNEVEKYFNMFKSIIWFKMKFKEQIPFIKINGIDYPIENCLVEDIYYYLIENNYLFDQDGYLECLEN